MMFNECHKQASAESDDLCVGLQISDRDLDVWGLRY
jgi:hypothetical protein